MPDAQELVERFFSPRENAQFRALPDEQKQEGFFNLWTRKEALLKATGEGIGYMLNKVEVSFLPGDRPQFLSLPEGQVPRGAWGLFHLSPTPGFVGAAAIPVRNITLFCRGWKGTRPDGKEEVFAL
jgi:4'-phosphopantetheinyl transferase